jgi:hypothetical protein
MFSPDSPSLRAAQGCRASSTQRIVGLSVYSPHCRRNPRLCSRLEAVRRFSLKFSRKDLAGFIVHFSGGRPPKFLPYWSGPFTLAETNGARCPFYGLLTCGAAVVTSGRIHSFDSRFGHQAPERQMAALQTYSTNTVSPRCCTLETVQLQDAASTGLFTLGTGDFCEPISSHWCRCRRCQAVDRTQMCGFTAGLVSQLR